MTDTDFIMFTRVTFVATSKYSINKYVQQTQQLSWDGHCLHPYFATGIFLHNLRNNY